MAYIHLKTNTGIVQLTDTRNTLTLLQKGGTQPAGTEARAIGPGGVEYFFGLPQTTSNYGVITKDASGNVLFDAVAHGKLARPVGVMSGDIIPPTLTETKSFAVPAGKTYAVWIVAPVSPLYVRTESGTVGGVVNYWYYLDEQEMSVTTSSGFIHVTATRTQSNNRNGETSTGPYDSQAKFTWQAIVLDVTNY